MKSLCMTLILLGSSLSNAAPLNLVAGPFNSGKIFVPCDFDGNQQECMIDTGSTQTFIKKDPFSLSYPSMGVVEHGGASGSTVQCDLINIENFSLDSHFPVVDLEAARCPIGESKEVPISESIIGLDIFGHNIVQFNFLTGELLQQSEIPTMLDKFPIQQEPRGHFSIGLTSGNVSTYGIWDTGAGLTSIDQVFVSKHPENFEYIQDIWGNDGIGDPILMKLYRAKKISIGDHSFADVHIIAFDFTPIRPYFNQNIDYIIGYNLIIKANWYFDFAANQWAID